MSIEIITQPDYCEEFSWDSCTQCSYAIENEENVLECPKLKDIDSCDGCPFSTGEDNESFCNPSPDGFHPCEYDDYKEMLIPDLIRHLGAKEMEYERHLTLQEKEEERKQVVKEERKVRASKTKGSTHEVNYKIKIARRKLAKLQKAESSERSLFTAFSVVDNMMNGTEKKEFISRYASSILEVESQINLLIEERKEVSKNTKKELQAKEDKVLLEKVNTCISSIVSVGINKPSDILVMLINDKAVGVSCEVDKVTYLSLSKLSKVKPSAKAIREKYTRVDFTFDGCNENLLKRFNEIKAKFYTSSLVVFKDEYISKPEKLLSIKNMEITDNTIKDEILKAVIK